MNDELKAKAFTSSFIIPHSSFILDARRARVLESELSRELFRRRRFLPQR
jgi:chemotaxis methyl-accepting protein methylase